MSLSLRVRSACVLLPLAAVTSGCELMVAGPRAQATDHWERTYQVEPTASLEVENTNGAITVRPHSGDTIQVKATRTARAVTEQAAKELLARLNLEESTTRNRVRLVTPRPQGLSRGQQVEVRYEVLVPPTVAVVLTTVNGHVDVEGISGTVALETVNGGISARALPGLRKAETVNGSVELALDGLPGAGASVETVNGSVAVSLPSALGVDVSVRTVNGAIDVTGFAATTERARRRRHFDGTLNGGGATLRVETVNGAVSLSGRSGQATAPAAGAGAP